VKKKKELNFYVKIHKSIDYKKVCKLSQKPRILL